MNLSLRRSIASGFRILSSGLLAALAASAALGLAACSGAVGSGNAPVRLVISSPNSTTALPTLHMYQCLTSGLRAVLYFTDGSAGDFTSRVTWSSSNPGAVRVSNGDVAAPGGFYSHGALIPTGSGNAVVTADYFGIRSQIAISVGTPQSIKLRAVINGDYVPLDRVNTNRTADSDNFTLGQGTTLQLAAVATLDNVETDVTSFATFGFEIPNNNVAVFNAQSSAISAVTAGGPLVPVASFAPCSFTNITNPADRISMTVSKVQNITLQPEFLPADPSQPPSDTNPLPQIVVGNTERFKTIASLANGDQQDVSTQAVLTATGSSAATVAGNLVTAASAGGPVILTSVYNSGGSALTAPSIVTSTRLLTLSFITTCWSDIYTRIQSCPTNQAGATVQAGSLTPLQFHAIGSYGLDDQGNEITQDVTRGTTWLSTDTGVASIANSATLAGQALGVSQGSVTIQATNNNAVNVPQTFTQLVVNPIQ